MLLEHLQASEESQKSPNVASSDLVYHLNATRFVLSNAFEPSASPNVVSFTFGAHVKRVMAFNSKSFDGFLVPFLIRNFSK